jgi:hypothetical protein
MFLSATYLYKVFPRSRFFGRERMTWWDFNEEREVETVCGCYSLVRKDAIDQVGMMDPTYFVYGDDPDWCYRFKKAGWKMLFTPDAQIIHIGGQTTKQMARAFRLQLYGSQLIFMKKFSTRFKFSAACILTGLFFLLRAPFWFFAGVLTSEMRSEYIRAAKTCLLGSYYCIFNWKNLLMNRQEIEHQLQRGRLTKSCGR